MTTPVSHDTHPDGMATSTLPPTTQEAPPNADGAAPSVTVAPRADTGTTTRPGATLKAEVESLLSQQKWRKAARVAETAQKLDPDDLELEGMLAIATANRRFGFDARVRAKKLHERLTDDSDLPAAERAAGYTARSGALLALDDYRGADAAARSAIELAPTDPRPWWSLASSYAGLGWFDEADACLATGRSKTGEPVPPFARWQVGRAINRWAMTRSPYLFIGVMGVLFLGVLGFAFAVTTPFATREYRVARLDRDSRALADDAWRSASGLRVAAAASVAMIIVLWVVVLSLATPA